MKAKFRFGDRVKYIKTGTIYRISALPEDLKLLEECNLPYYEYYGEDVYKISGKKVTWARRHDTMEDGRFVLVTESDK